MSVTKPRENQQSLLRLQRITEEECPEAKIFYYLFHRSWCCEQCEDTAAKVTRRGLPGDAEQQKKKKTKKADKAAKEREVYTKDKNEEKKRSIALRNRSSRW